MLNVLKNIFLLLGKPAANPNKVTAAINAAHNYMLQNILQNKEFAV